MDILKSCNTLFLLNEIKNNMLTSKQIKELPKGEYSNTQLAVKFPTHGKRSRVSNVPVDRLGNMVNVLSAKFVRVQPMRLNRQMSRRYQ